MAYKIETISVYEVFEKKCTCPLCSLQNKLEADYVDYYLGNAAMLPEIRVEVNKHGFCGKHLDMLASAGNKLPLALQMHTYLGQQNKRVEKAALDYAKKCCGRSKNAEESLKKLGEVLDKNNSECLICKSTRENMDRYIQTLISLYFDEQRFRLLFDDCNGFCQKHFYQLLIHSRKVCSSKQLQSFTDNLIKLQGKQMQALEESVEHFTKMFDYRSKDLEWGDSRTAVARSVQVLGGSPVNEKK